MKPILLLSLAAISALSAADAPFVKPATWGAYFHDIEKGTDSNLPPTLEKVEAKTWMGLTWTDFKGAKLRIAVMPVENKAAQGLPQNMPAALAAMYGSQFAQIPVAGIEDLLGSSLASTGRFRLFERKAFGAVQGEKAVQADAAAAQVKTDTPNANQNDMAALIRAAAAASQAANAPAIDQAARDIQAAKTLGAQYVVLASVVEWTPDKSKKSAGGGAAVFSGKNSGLLNGLSLIAGAISKSEAEVAMTFRIVDTATSEVKWQIDERATAGNWGFSLGGGSIGRGGAGAVGGGMTEKTPINYAIKACINKAVYRIAQTLKGMPWTGAVIKAAPDKVYINAGKDTGLEPGMVLKASSVGEVLKDPATGEILDAETKPAGEITLTEVRDRIAIGTLANAPAGVDLKAGDRVVLASPQN